MVGPGRRGATDKGLDRSMGERSGRASEGRGGCWLASLGGKCRGGGGSERGVGPGRRAGEESTRIRTFGGCGFVPSRSRVFLEDVPSFGAVTALVLVATLFWAPSTTSLFLAGTTLFRGEGVLFTPGDDNGSSIGLLWPTPIDLSAVFGFSVMSNDLDRPSPSTSSPPHSDKESIRGLPCVEFAVESRRLGVRGLIASEVSVRTVRGLPGLGLASSCADAGTSAAVEGRRAPTFGLAPAAASILGLIVEGRAPILGLAPAALDKASVLGLLRNPDCEAAMARGLVCPWSDTLGLPPKSRAGSLALSWTLGLPPKSRAGSLTPSGATYC